MSESAEDLLPADPVLVAVDRFGWPGADLGVCELAKRTVRAARVVVAQVLCQHLAQVVLIDDQQPVEEFPAQVPIILSRPAFALGACGGLLIPSAVKTASKELVNWPARSQIRNLTEAARHQELRAACVVHAPSGCAVVPARWTRRCEPRPVAWLVAHPADLAAQHGVLVLEHSASLGTRPRASTTRQPRRSR